MKNLNLNSTEVSLLTQAKDRCYPGLLDDFWTQTIERILCREEIEVFTRTDYASLSELREEIATVLDHNSAQ